MTENLPGYPQYHIGPTNSCHQRGVENLAFQNLSQKFCLRYLQDLWRLLAGAVGSDCKPDWCPLASLRLQYCKQVILSLALKVIVLVLLESSLCMNKDYLREFTNR